IGTHVAAAADRRGEAQQLVEVLARLSVHMTLDVGGHQSPLFMRSNTPLALPSLSPRALTCSKRASTVRVRQRASQCPAAWPPSMWSVSPVTNVARSR